MSIYPAIYDKVRQTPVGEVCSYKQVAQAAGLFRGAQVVGWALKALPDGVDVPWHRVINQKGQISIINLKFPKSLQKELLEAEGVTVVESQGYFTVSNATWYCYPENPEAQGEGQPA